MTVRNRHAQTLRGDVGFRRIDDLIALDMAPELHRLLLGLFPLAADIGDHVVDHFRPCLKCSACAGNCLICADQRLFHAVFHQRVQCRDIALQAAIGFDGDKAALCAEPLALCVDDADVVGVDLRHDHRHVGRVAVGGIV